MEIMEWLEAIEVKRMSPNVPFVRDEAALQVTERFAACTLVPHGLAPRVRRRVALRVRIIQRRRRRTPLRSSASDIGVRV